MATALAVLVAVLSISASADMAAPTATLSSVYFLDNGTPFNGAVNFTISCYSSDYANFSMTSFCPSYGCQVDQVFYDEFGGNYEYCDLYGTAGGQDFLIHNYSTTVIPIQLVQGQSNYCTLSTSGESSTFNCPLTFDIGKKVLVTGNLTNPAPVNPVVVPPAPVPSTFSLTGFLQGIACFIMNLFSGGSSCPA